MFTGSILFNKNHKGIIIDGHYRLSYPVFMNWLWIGNHIMFIGTIEYF